MQIESLGLKTDIMISSLECEMYYEEYYAFMKTPNRPDFYWGNFLITQAVIESQAELDALISVYKRHFDSYDKFITIAFDIPMGDVGRLSVFKNNDFDVYTNLVMQLDKKDFKLKDDLNENFTFRVIKTSDFIDQLVELHHDPEWKYGPGQDDFLKSKFESLIKLEDKGMGNRYVLMDDDKLVADLGIYYENKLGRFNDVVTHIDYRNQGLCYTLVSKATEHIFNNTDVETLVMQAEEDYFAHNIYRKAGFDETEKLVSIEWVSEKKTSKSTTKDKNNINQSTNKSNSFEIIYRDVFDVYLKDKMTWFYNVLLSIPFFPFYFFGFHTKSISFVLSLLLFNFTFLVLLNLAHIFFMKKILEKFHVPNLKLFRKYLLDFYIFIIIIIEIKKLFFPGFPITIFYLIFLYLGLKRDLINQSLIGEDLPNSHGRWLVVGCIIGSYISLLLISFLLFAFTKYF